MLDNYCFAKNLTGAAVCETGAARPRRCRRRRDILYNVIKPYAAQHTNTRHTITSPSVTTLNIMKKCKATLLSYHNNSQHNSTKNNATQNNNTQRNSKKVAFCVTLLLC